MKFKEPGPSIRTSLLGLLILACAFPLSTAEMTMDDFKKGIEGADEKLECYVCNSIFGGCETTFQERLKCNDISDQGYLQHVYGDKALEATDINHWPSSLTEIAASGSTKPGWTYSGFPSEYTKFPASSTGESLRVSGLLDKEKMFEKGFRSCRKMVIYTDSQKNDGSSQEIPETRPRIIRTCSLVDAKGEGLSLNDKGCRKINTKTATIEICYCKENNCNGSSYLRMSQYLILAASLLVFIAKIGMDTHS